MMKKQIDINTISVEKLQFAQEGVRLADKKLQTKPRSYFKDAWIRFKKNKSSVVAACIIAFLALYAIVVPFLSPYTLEDTDKYYLKMTNYVYGSEWLGDGCKKADITENLYKTYGYYAIETGLDIVEKVYGEPFEDATLKTTKYTVDVNEYKRIGVKKIDVTLEEFYKIQEFQDAHNIQIILPALKTQSDTVNKKALKDIYNYWYLVDVINNTLVPVNEKGDIVESAEDLVPMYVEYNPLKNNDFYKSKMRIEGDQKLYEYYRITGAGKDAYDEKGQALHDEYGNEMYTANGEIMKIPTQVSIRVSYFHYYAYENSVDGNAVYPGFLFGTDNYGRDIMVAIALGARISLILAVCVSVINFIIGLFYGSVQGFYGGAVDMVLDRISDILSGIPFIVVATLFQLHLSEKVGPLPSLLFAFVATGWIGTAALVRKQFYRFKGQEYVTVAKSLGASDSRIMFKHIFPNSLGTIVTSSALVIPSVISSETMLTYLGIIQLNGTGLTTLGIILSEAKDGFEAAPHVLLIPSLYLALLLISFNLFGNGLRDAFNPSLRGSED